MSTSTSREESPDWLRSFKAPTPLALSSGSESPSNDSPLSDDEDGMSLGKLFSKAKPNTIESKYNLDGDDSLIIVPSKQKSPARKARVEHTPGGKRKRESQLENEGKDVDDVKVFSKRKATEKLISHEEPKNSIWSLSSDPESCPHRKGPILDRDLLAHNEAQDVKSEATKDPDFLDNDGESAPTEDLKMKSPKKQSDRDIRTPKKRKEVEKTTNEDVENKANMDVLEEDIPEKHNAMHSRLPLLLPEKVQRLKALVECDGDSIDLSGDVGAVGRVVISDNPSRSSEMLLDLKGTIYKTTIVPSRTFCVVSFGQSEAKIEAIMNDFIQLTPKSNVYEAETMVEGTLDGFSFDSEEEADNLPKKADEGNQNEAIEDETNGKAERKAKKSLGAGQKKGKSGVGKQVKQPKKAKKKPQVAKKNKKK